ncbi:MAG: AAA family ATPase, partial [Clostridia bacterium]|nr:AAA family ATPase [Clostridia bacterium]
MNFPICSRCNKNPAVVFVTKIENGQSKQEGLCIQCARELGIKPVTDLMDRFGITDDDLQNMTRELTENDGDLFKNLLSSFQNPDGAEDALIDGEADEDDEQDGRAPAFPLFPGFNFGRPSKKTEEHEEEPKSGKKNKKSKFLSKYALNLTDRARNNKLDRVIGRESETERVIQILNRRQKNNPCLIGEPGVGKTAVAEGLAQKIAVGDVPFKLKDKEIWLLDMTAMVAGTQFRGQFESRMKSLIDEVKALGNIILVIDEVHNLVGAG